jgi:hypothetical protein
MILRATLAGPVFAAACASVQASQRRETPAPLRRAHSNGAWQSCASATLLSCRLALRRDRNERAGRIVPEWAPALKGLA